MGGGKQYLSVFSSSLNPYQGRLPVILCSVLGGFFFLFFFFETYVAQTVSEDCFLLSCVCVLLFETYFIALAVPEHKKILFQFTRSLSNESRSQTGEMAKRLRLVIFQRSRVQFPDTTW